MHVERNGTVLRAQRRLASRMQGTLAFSRQRLFSTLSLVGLLGVADALLPRSSAQSADTQEGKPLLIPLHRQTMPIAGSDQVIHTYFGSIELGQSHKQEFSMIFDTGSGHVVVPSVECGSPACIRHRRYNRSASVDAITVGSDGKAYESGAEFIDEVVVEFGTGEITAQFAREMVCIGGSSLSTRSTSEQGGKAYCVPMNILEAVAMSDEPFESFAFDGVFGLGLKSLAVSPQFSFFHELTSMGVARPQFAIFLAREPEEQGDCGYSELAMGGYNADRLQGPVYWAPVAAPEEGYWQVRVNAVRVGDRTIGSCSVGAGCRGIVDSGTSMLGVPTSIVSQLEAALSVELPPREFPASSADTKSFNCHEQLGAERRLYLELEGGIILTLDPSDYASRTPITHGDTKEGGATEQKLTCGPRFAGVGHTVITGENMSSTNANSASASGIDHSADLPGLFILGEPVLRRYYAIFDWSGPRVGFGAAAQCFGSDDRAIKDSSGGGLVSTSPSLLGVGKHADAVEGTDGSLSGIMADVATRAAAKAREAVAMALYRNR